MSFIGDNINDNIMYVYYNYFTIMFQLIFCESIYLILAFILLFHVKYVGNQGKDELFYSLNSLRGIFALEIVIGHCVRYEFCPLTPLGNFMIISVGYFFFVSGYGLSRSYQIKPNYMDNFLKHRILRLILLALEALIIITLIAYICPVVTDFKSISTMPKIFARSVLIRTNWYMRELLLLYVCFFIVFRFIRKHRNILLSILIILICIILYLNGYTRCWFASIVCFPMGIICHENIDKIIIYLKSIKGKILSSIIAVTGLILSLLNYPDITGQAFEVTELIYALANNILCVGFVLALMIILLYFKPGNKILSFFTSIAAELYLFQFIFVAIAEKMKLSYPVKTIFVLTFDIILAMLIHFVLNHISKFISKKQLAS